MADPNKGGVNNNPGERFVSRPAPPTAPRIAKLEAAEVASDELDDLFALHRTEIVRLKAELAEARAELRIADLAHADVRIELAEARAQIAAYERAAKEGDTDPTTGRYTAEDIAHMKGMQFDALPKWAQNELIGMRAQIEAKDAEIEQIAEYVERAGADERDLRAQIAAKDALLRVVEAERDRAVKATEKISARNAELRAAVGRKHDEANEARAQKDAALDDLRKAYALGFENSAEGWNGEYPGGYETDDRWISGRDEDLLKAFSAKPDAQQAPDELAEARAQIADQNDALVEAANLRTELRAQIAALAARHEKALVEGAARLAELAEARAQIAAKDADRQMLWDLHQEFHTAVHQCEKCGEADPMETFDCTRMLDEYLSDEGPQEDLAAVYFERIKTLEREADEARGFAEFARAQIAAKDAALTRIAEANEGQGHCSTCSQSARFARAALAATARETK